MIYSIDWTIAAVALPHMQGTFSATQDQITWVMTSYIVVSAIVLPLSQALLLDSYPPEEHARATALRGLGRLLCRLER